MSHAPWTKIRASSAAEVCKNFPLKEDARPLLRAGQSPREFLEALIAGGKHAPAIEFLAHALPPREAIWWGLLCLQQINGSMLSPAETAACKAAVAWVLDPTEENRRAVREPAQAAGPSTPAGVLALAATWTGGSLAPDPKPNPNPKVPPPPPVPPGPFLPARAVAGAVLLVAVKGDPVRLAQTQRSFVELGIGVAEGRFVWPEVEKKSASSKTWNF